MATTPAVAQRSHTVVIEAKGCPSREEVAQQLAPLLDADRGAKDNAGSGADARVDDLGPRYRITVGDAVRTVEDPALLCDERARVAAVFIAMNLRADATEESPPQTTTPPVTPPTPSASGTEPPKTGPPKTGPPKAGPPKAGPPRAGPPRSRTERRGFVTAGLEYAVAPSLALGAFGPRIGATTSGTVTHLSVSLGLLLPARIELDGGGYVSVTRMPLTMSATPTLRAGPLAVGPTVGVVVDGVVLRGVDLPEERLAYRANPGALGGVTLRAPFSRRTSAFSSAAAAYYPHQYRLSVEPRGEVGRLPQLWFGVVLGLEWSAGRPRTPGGRLAARLPCAPRSGAPREPGRVTIEGCQPLRP